MALPNPGMDAVPFTPLTAEFLDDMIENIESLSDGTGFEAGAITTNTLAESAVTFSKTSGIWWEELKRGSLSTASASLEVSSIPVRKYLKVFFYTPSGVNLGFLFNNDSGGNYVFKYSTNSGQSGVTGNSILGTIGAGSNGTFGEMEIVNIASAKKVGHLRATWAGANASTAGDDSNFYFTWHNSSNAITSVKLQPSTGNLGIGTEIVVLGHN